MIYYPLAYSTWGNEELEAIQRVCDSDMYTCLLYTSDAADEP